MNIRIAIALLGVLAVIPASAQNRTFFGGLRNAAAYAYGVNGVAPALTIDSAPNATGAQTVTVAFGATTAGDGTVFSPLATNAAILVGGPTNQETVTPSAVSCSTPNNYATCTFTATFSNTHGRGESVSSATFGLVEAINLQNSYGGGTVVVDSGWITLGGTKSTITGVTAATPKVWIWDTSGSGPTWYGKSGTTSAAYSNVNNDMSFQLTLSAGTATKTFSQTYATAPNCVGSYISGTATGILKIVPTTTNLAVNDSVSEANVVQVSCMIQK